MAKNAITDYSSTAANNTDIGGVDAQGSAAASNIDDLIRELASHLADTNAGTSPWADTMTIGDAADLTKEFRFEASGITAGTTRVLTVPNYDGTIATLAGTETLTNKTLTSPVIGTGLELGHASDTTLTRGAAGFMAVEGNRVPSPASQAEGDVLYRGATEWQRLAIGTAGQLLTVNAGATAPEWAAAGSVSGTVPVGAVIPYAGTAAPTGWILCYGQAVSRATYSDLFTAISTTYGVGDGATTFNLPDLRGRVVAGQDDMGGVSANRLTNQTGGLDGDTLGATGGAETHALTAAQTPSNTDTGSNAGVDGAGTIDEMATTHTGSGDAHNNVQPTIILNYIIYAAA